MKVLSHTYPTDLRAGASRTLYQDAYQCLEQKPCHKQARLNPRYSFISSQTRALRRGIDMTVLSVLSCQYCQSCVKGIDTSSRFCRVASRAPEKRTARPQDGSKHLAASL